MNRLNSTNLRQIEGGRIVKQGDSASLFGFELLDEYWKPVELEGENATITLASSKGKAVFQGVVSNSKVIFRSSKVLPVESYLVEVSCGGYVFPSDQNVRVDVIQSADEYTSEQVLALVKNDEKEENGKKIEAHKENGIVEEFPDLTTLYNLAKI